MNIILGKIPRIANTTLKEKNKVWGLTPLPDFKTSYKAVKSCSNQDSVVLVEKNRHMDNGTDKRSQNENHTHTVN